MVILRQYYYFAQKSVDLKEELLYKLLGSVCIKKVVKYKNEDLGSIYSKDPWNNFNSHIILQESNVSEGMSHTTKWTKQFGIHREISVGDLFRNDTVGERLRDFNPLGKLKVEQHPVEEIVCGIGGALISRTTMKMSGGG